MANEPQYPICHNMNNHLYVIELKATAMDSKLQTKSPAKLAQPSHWDIFVLNPFRLLILKLYFKKHMALFSRTLVSSAGSPSPTPTPLLRPVRPWPLHTLTMQATVDRGVRRRCMQGVLSAHAPGLV